MPRATADTSKTERFDLKSLPEGFVVLRKLTYGQMLERQEKAGEMVAKMNGKQAPNEAAVRIMQAAATEYEFKHCIVEHNLEDENGKTLNFQANGTYRMLDPQVGTEIATLIDTMNQLPEEVAEGNS
jgi:hypothetical protein